MNSDEFDAHFIDVPRLTAAEIAAFLAAWTVVGPVVGPAVGPAVSPETHEDPADELIELITLLAATECAPRGDMRRRLSVRIEQTARGALRKTEPTKRGNVRAS